MDNLQIALRNEIMKICEQVNKINKCINNNIDSSDKDRDFIDNKFNDNISNIEQKNKINESISKKVRKRKEIPIDQRCSKIIVKNNKEVRCSFRKIEEKNFCKKHLKN